MLQTVPATSLGNTFGLIAGSSKQMEYTLFKIQTINASKKETLSCNTTIVHLSNKDNTLCELQKLIKNTPVGNFLEKKSLVIRVFAVRVGGRRFQDWPFLIL